MATYFTFPPATIRVPISPHLSQHLFSLLWITAIWVAVKWYLSLVLICIFLITNNTKHFFHVLISHLHIFFEEMTFQALYFPIVSSSRLVVGVLYILMYFLFHVFYIYSHQTCNFQIFSLTLWVVFHSHDCVLWCTKVHKGKKI